MVGIMPAAIAIEVSSEQQRELQRIVTAKRSSQRDVFRARIILSSAEGLSHEEISRKQGVSFLAIGRWRKRWAAKGLEGLKDAPGRGRKPTIAATAIRSALAGFRRPSSLGVSAKYRAALFSQLPIASRSGATPHRRLFWRLPDSRVSPY